MGAYFFARPKTGAQGPHSAGSAGEFWPIPPGARRTAALAECHPHRVILSGAACKAAQSKDLITIFIPRAARFLFREPQHIVRRGENRSGFPSDHGKSFVSFKTFFVNIFADFLKKAKPRFWLFPLTPRPRRTERVKPHDFYSESRSISCGEGKTVRVSPPITEKSFVSFKTFFVNSKAFFRIA